MSVCLCFFFTKNVAINFEKENLLSILFRICFLKYI